MADKPVVADLFEGKREPIEIFKTAPPQFSSYLADFTSTAFAPLKSFLIMLENHPDSEVKRIGLVARRLLRNGTDLFEKLDKQLLEAGVRVVVGAEGPTCTELEDVVACSIETACKVDQNG